MDDKKKYVELFYRVTFQGDDFHTEKCKEIDYPTMAEVMVPYHTDTTIYAVTCYITNYPNDRPVLLEALRLQNFINQHGIEGL